MKKLQFNSIPTWDDVIQNRDTINEPIDEQERIREAIRHLAEQIADIYKKLKEESTQS
jgi:hypothetical protein